MPTQESEVQRAIRSLGPARAFQTLIAENDALIASDRWDFGGKIVKERTAI